MNLDEIQQIFFQECEEGLATMEASFASVRQGGHDTETINTIFRSVHSIKGGAGAFGRARWLTVSASVGAQRRPTPRGFRERQ